MRAHSFIPELQIGRELKSVYVSIVKHRLEYWLLISLFLYVEDIAPGLM
jgi:hypothetical protein